MSEQSGQQKEKRQHLWRLSFLVAGMFAFGFALGPLYTAICEATGVNGRMKVVANQFAGQVETSRTATGEFGTQGKGKR